MDDTIDISGFTPIVQDGYTYWLSKRIDGRLPSWRHINPAEMKKLLPSISVIQVSHDPLDFVEKITGDKILRNSYANSMGRNWLEFEGRGPGSRIWETHAEAVRTGQANFQSIPYVGPHREFMRVETVICPLSDDNKTVDRILSFVEFCAAVNTENG